jgi:hypothetical protein
VVGSTFYSSVKLYLIICQSGVVTKYYWSEISKWKLQTLATAIHFSEVFLLDGQTKLIKETAGN